jgi:hypothetical protein
MCHSSYDTFIYVYDEEMNNIACNDDYYFEDDGPCHVYASKIEHVALDQGATYYIIVAGYAGCGDYQIDITEYEPCVLACSGSPEGEPALHDGYVDEYNGGCLSAGTMQALNGDQAGDLIVCGKSGWYGSADGGARRDTDWFVVTVGSAGLVEWTMEAEERTTGHLLEPHDCDAAAVVANLIVERCTEETLAMPGQPGDVLWFWVGPTTFAPPSGFVGHEYDYVCRFSGLEASIVVEPSSWGSVKSLFR